MENGFDSWFQTQQIDWQSTNPNSSSIPFNFPHRLNIPSFGNILSSNMTNGIPFGQLYGQSFTNPVVNSIPKEQLPEKKFLVFDQSNDRTTLIYSSNPMQFHLQKPQPTFNPKKEIPILEKNENTRHSNPFLDDKNDTESEMHEDTEELKALLYSDDDEFDYSEDEEEQSTGHSPSTMTGFDNNNVEEVASSMGFTKKRKLDNGVYDVEDTASSGKSGVNCSGVNSGDGNGVPDVESETFPASKRLRKDKVRETINVLRNLIPGGKNGNDAMVIIDEAINYLRILKVQAQALGLDD